MKKNVFAQLMTLLDQLEAHEIAYTLTRIREEALLVNVAVPGARWEIEFLVDDTVEIERFHSNGEIEDETALVELLARYGAPVNGVYDADTVIESPLRA
ncbi:MAG: hypothetical protein R3C14_18560 [Caldilineaceae bacterium]